MGSLCNTASKLTPPNSENKLHSLGVLHAKALQSLFQDNGPQSVDASVFAKVAIANAMGEIQKTQQLTETTGLQCAGWMEELKEIYMPEMDTEDASTANINASEVATQSAIDTLFDKIAMIYNEMDIDIDKVERTTRSKWADVGKAIQEHTNTIQTLRRKVESHKQTLVNQGGVTTNREWPPACVPEAFQGCHSHTPHQPWTHSSRPIPGQHQWPLPPQAVRAWARASQLIAHRFQERQHPHQTHRAWANQHRGASTAARGTK